MFTEFTNNYTEASAWGWDSWKHYINELQVTELRADNVVAWLKQSDSIRKMLFEVRERLILATMVDTSDEAAATALKHFLNDISPKIDTTFFALDTALVESGFAPDALRVPLRNLEASLRLFNEDNLPLIAQESQLNLQYNKIAGAQTVEWEGKTIPLTRLSPIYEERDRERRKSAWLLAQERLKQDRAAHNALWRQYMDLRIQIAKNSGFDDYRQYAWLKLSRHDYTPNDVRQFILAIQKIVVPVQARLHEKRRKQLNYDTLHPWDLSVDPLEHPPVKPYTDINDFINKSESIFHKVDPELGANFTTVKNENLLDLENRTGKSPGGQLIPFESSNQAFIFMNSVNIAEDVTVLLHEAGHAFHMVAKNKLDYMLQRWVTAEFNEVASMAMELLASPFLTTKYGGYFTEVEAARFRANHLRSIINTWIYVALGANFQHWIYTNQQAASNPTNCDAKWLELHTLYYPTVDWHDYQDFILNRWRSAQHFFIFPFYMIEYGLAQLGAVQIYANALQDQPNALKKYRKALALGGTATLPQLYQVAGAKFAFDAKTLKRAVDLVENHIKHFESLEKSNTLSH